MSSVKVTVTNDFYFKDVLVEKGEVIEVDSTLVASLIEKDVIAETKSKGNGGGKASEATGGEKGAKAKADNKTTDGADNNGTGDATT